MKRRHIEAEHQRALFAWAKLAERQHPELAWLFHVPNGEKRDARTAAMLKAMGVKRGVPDIWLPLPRGGYCGLVIELKVPGGRQPTDAQNEWLVALYKVGWRSVVCYGWEVAREDILAYLSVQGPFQSSRKQTG